MAPSDKNPRGLSGRRRRQGHSTPIAVSPSADPPLFRFFNEIGIIDQLSSRILESVLPADMTLPQFVVLNHLVRLGPASSPNRLARAFQVRKGAMTNTLGHLERKGFVSIVGDPSDGRAKIVTITEAGRNARQAALAALRPSIEDLANAISVADLLTCLPILERVRSYLDRKRDIR
jgi:DNA-binding MarR family transcriptional regulator